MENALNIKNLSNVKCEKCASQVFQQSYAIKKVSALLNETGKEQMIPVPIFMCVNCKHVNSIFGEVFDSNISLPHNADNSTFGIVR